MTDQKFLLEYLATYTAGGVLPAVMPASKRGYVYVLHAETPLAHAQHYVGWAKDLGERLHQHQSGHGARLTQVWVEQGIKFEIVVFFLGDRGLERELKNMKNTRMLCPICRKACIKHKNQVKQAWRRSKKMAMEAVYEQ